MSHSTELRGGAAFLGGLGLGALAGYLLERGAARRERPRAARSAEHVPAGREAPHRTVGVLASRRSSVRYRRAEDDVLADHVRFVLDHLVSHPRAVDVTTQNGRVILDGAVLADEVGGLLAGVMQIRGVTGIDNHLEVRRTPDVPRLRDEGRRPRRREWTPATRVLAGAAGTALGLHGLERSGPGGVALRVLGVGLLVRAVTNLPLGRLFGLGVAPHALYLRRTIHVDAPLDQVFAFLSRLESFPRFMEHVRAVEMIDARRSRWKVAGPAGVTAEWDTELTELVSNQVIGWRTAANAAVEHAGVIRLAADADGGTRLDIRLSYRPVAGALGHLVAALFGADPGRALDEDLARLKMLLEGRARARGERAAREELSPPEGTPVHR